MARTYVGAASSAVMAACFAGTPALGQTMATGNGAAAPSTAAPPLAIEEITVTARKREERLFDVPGPVSAISAQQIEALRLRDARDYLSLVPTAYLDESDSSGSEKNFSIRGVSTPNIFAEPGVALYIDDIFSNGFISYPLQLHDIDRIEVERGPQGGLYGRDAVGGAVNVISKPPGTTDEAGATLTYASFNRVELDAYGNAAVSDKVQLRFAAWGVNQPDGEYFNQTLHRPIDATDYAGGRAQAAIDLTDQLHLALLVEHTEGDTAGTYLYFPGIETQSTLQRDTEPTNSYDTTRYAANLQYQTGIGLFSLIFGGREYTLAGVEDTDLSAIAQAKLAAGIIGQEVTDRQDSVSSKSVELRYLSDQFGPVNILSGIVYLDESAQGAVATDLNGLTAALHAPVVLDIDNDQSLQSVAFYVEPTWTITSGLDLIVDLRYTDDMTSEQFAFAPSPLGAALLGAGQTAHLSKNFYRFSPGGTLAWSPTPDLRVYGKIQTGFRSGGFNFNVGSVKDLPYNEETSVNYEIGAKEKFLDGKAYVALTGYLLRQNDTLVSALDLSQPPPLESFLVNAGQARTYGVELESSITPLDGLQLTAATSYQDAQFDGGTLPGANQPLAGDSVPGVRKWSVALTGNYRRPITDDVALLLNASYTYRSDTLDALTSNLRFDAANLVNFSAGLDFGRYDVRAFVENLLDDQYITAFGGFRDNRVGIEQAQGRTAGVTLGIKL